MATILATRKKQSWATARGISHARTQAWPVPDKGGPGKYKGKKWFQPTGSLHGWEAEAPVSERHAALNKSVRADSYPTTIRRLNALKNVSTVRDVDRAATKDMQYLRNKYR